jgi:hypothetical protein
MWGAFAAAFAFAGGLVSRNLPMATTAAIFGFVVSGILGWVFNPAIGWGFIIPWVTAIFWFGVGGFLSSGSEAKGGTVGFGIAIVAFIVLCLGAWFTSAGMFHASSYRALLGTPKATATFKQDVATIDTTRLRVVSESYATQIADKLLGEQPGLGSTTDLDKPHISQINGCFTVKTVGSDVREKICFKHELVWIAPLKHSGFWKWMSNRTVRQYAIVSASDPSRRWLIEEVNGKPVTLKYHMHGAHFGDYLERHLRENGFLTDGIYDTSFEVDDSGKPYWVAVLFEKKIGFFGSEVTGIAVVDPDTGAIQRFAPEDAPVWVDRIYPEQMVINQFDQYGKYVLGWGNAWALGPKREITQTSTDYLHIVEGVDGRTYWYTGITSIGADQSTTGFILVDTRTKATTVYRIPGAIEDAAKRSAEAQPGVRERSYTADEAILYNWGGEPTYFMTLSGSNSVPQMYAFVSVRDFQLVGVASNIEAALVMYEEKLRARKGASLGQTLIAVDLFENKVLRIVREGDSWAFLLNGTSGFEFIAPSNISPELRYTQPGDLVRLQATKGGSPQTRRVTKFENLDVPLTAGSVE